MLDVLQRPIADLPPVLALPGAAPSFDVQVRPPGSKSLTNRALLLASLAQGTSRISNALREADDARAMIVAVGQLGAEVAEGSDGVLWVKGVDGRWKVGGPTRLDLGNAGTAARFLAAAAVLSSAPITIDGNARMRERPIGDLAGVLAKLSCGIHWLGREGFPPVTVTPPAAGTVFPPVLDVKTTQSSQFISGLLMAGPWMERGITLRLLGEVTSASYIAMTLGLLTKLGASVRTSEDLHVVRVGPAGTAEGQPRGASFPGFEYEVEPDASGATYFWAGAAMCPGARCRVLGLDETSLQGDSRFPEVLGRMGVKVTRAALPAAEMQTIGPRELRPILADMSDMPDAAMTLASVACFASGTSILRGLRTLHIKECDRVAAMETELSKLGVIVQTRVQGDPDAMTITPPPGGIDCTPTAPPVLFETYDDHRMAMSLALIALRRPNVSIKNPACVAKTYPRFWADFAGFFEK